MLTLSLMRHAKSDWNDPELGDFDRPLAKRGQRAAPLMDDYMHEMGVKPDLILCSTARRTTETLNLLRKTFNAAKEVVFEDKLYMGSARRMLNLATNVSVDCSHVMLIAHNPGMHELALALAELSTSDEYQMLVQKYPTAALSVIEFQATNWADIMPGRGRLKTFMTPRLRATQITEKSL